MEELLEKWPIQGQFQVYFYVVKCEVIDNMCETFNEVALDARSKLMISMLAICDDMDISEKRLCQHMGR